MKFPPSEFWNFSTEVYQRPETEQACLHLQDQYQADINILLYCCWAGQKQILLSENDLSLLIKTSMPWQKNILTHLRAARTTLKTSKVIIPDELREQTRSNISEMELNAEHMAQLDLEKALNLKKKAIEKHTSAEECCLHNLNLYCQQMESPLSTEDISRELTLITYALRVDKNSAGQAKTSSQESA